MIVHASGSLFAVSAAILLAELYWLRAFAEAEWGHLASMVVSTALLGIGVGGTIVVALGKASVRRAARYRTMFLVGFVVLATIVPVLLARLPLEPMLLAWRLSAWGWVLVREALVALPFAAGAAFVALTFRLSPDRVARLYAVNLLGSASGVVIGLLFMAGRPTAELNAAAVAAGAVALLLARHGRERVTAALFGAVAVVVATVVSEPRLAETKDLAQALRLPAARVLEERSGIPGRWTLLESPSLHIAPGVSLSWPGPTPETRAIFVRGDLTEVAYARAHATALRHRVAWLPYALRPPDSVLVLGPGAVLEVEAALLSGAGRTVAVIPDSRTRAALRGDLGRFAGVSPEAIELRGYGVRAALEREHNRFDLVTIPPSDSLGAAAAGLGATTENWILTVEGLRAALAATTTRGVVAIQRWTQAPPRDLPKLVATLVRAFDGPLGAEHIALVRSWDAWTLCVSRTPFDADDRRRLREFAVARGFDVLLPEATPDPPQHQLPGPAPGPLVESILASGGELPRGGVLTLEPATDARPFFHQYLSYRHLGEWLSLLRDGAIAPSEWGDIFLAAGLLSSVLLGALGIATPAIAAAGPRALIASRPGDTLLFGAIGLGYMALQMLFLHQGTKLLGPAGPSAALTVAAFLLGSGIGSAMLSRLGERGAAGPMAAFLVAALAAAVAHGLDTGLDRVATVSTPAAAGVFFLAAFFVAVPLGMPFPAGLARAGIDRPAAIPWLFAVNGWASVVGATAASLGAVIGGFPAVALTAAALYIIAGTLLLSRRTPRIGTSTANER